VSPLLDKTATERKRIQIAKEWTKIRKVLFIIGKIKKKLFFKCKKKSGLGRKISRIARKVGFVERQKFSVIIYEN